MLARRVEMGYRGRGDFAKLAELSVKTIGEIERADRQSYDPATLAHLERVLGWDRGTVSRLLHDEPAPPPMVMTDHGPLSRTSELVIYALDSGRLRITPKQRERLAFAIETAVLPYLELAIRRDDEDEARLDREQYLYLVRDDEQRTDRERRESAGG